MIQQADVIAYVLADLALILLATRIAGRLAVALGRRRVVGETVGGIAIDRGRRSASCCGTPTSGGTRPAS